MQASAARTNINVSCDQVFVITQVNARRDISEMHISSNLAHGMEISNSQNSKSYISKVNMDYNYPTEFPEILQNIFYLSVSADVCVEIVNMYTRIIGV